MQQTRAEALENDLSNDTLYIFVGNKVSGILVKNRKLLMLVIQGTEAPLYTIIKRTPAQLTNMRLCAVLESI